MNDLLSKTNNNENNKNNKNNNKNTKGKFVSPRTFLGVSQFATAIGLSTTFSTPELLKKQLEEGYYQEETPAMTFGLQNEDIAKKYYEHIKGVKVLPTNYKIFDSCHRLKGGCDGLIGKDGGLEIKCHFNYTYSLQKIPDYYLIQIAGYIYLYDREWFDFMSCCFGPTGKISDYNIIRVYRADIENQWNNEWFPKLVEFVNSVKWHDMPKSPILDKSS